MDDVRLLLLSSLCALAPLAWVVAWSFLCFARWPSRTLIDRLSNWIGCP
jgi:hypothetical protein